MGVETTTSLDPRTRVCFGVRRSFEGGETVFRRRDFTVISTGFFHFLLQ